MQMVLWSKLDSGRQGCDRYLWIYGYAELRSSLQQLHLSALREILNVSSHSSINGVLGETGCLPDLRRGELHSLQTFRRCLVSPPDSLPHRIAAGFLASPPHSTLPPILAHIRFLCDQYGLTSTQFTAVNAKAIIKKAVTRKVIQEWRSQVKGSRHLSVIFGHSSFSCQPYLDLDAL